MTSAADWRVVGETRDRLGESPLWHPREQVLYWIDFYGPTDSPPRPATGAYRRWTLDVAPTIGSLCFAEDGRLLLAMENGVYLFDHEDGSQTFAADPNMRRPGIGYNDAKVDRDGRYWVGSWETSERAPRAILYRIDADGQAAVGDSGFIVCNGPAFSPSGETMYFSNSAARRLLAYELDRSTGALSEPRVLVQLRSPRRAPGRPGRAAPARSIARTTGGGRITRFSPGGERLAVLHLPVRNVTELLPGRAGPRHSLCDDRRGWRRPHSMAPCLHSRSPLRGSLSRSM